MCINQIKIHKSEDFHGMRRAGQLAASLLDYITPYIQPGVTTAYLDNLCAAYTKKHNAISAPLGYKNHNPCFPNFPKSICTSLNRVVCHGIPDETILRSGDILNIDVTVILNGWHGDTSRMFYVGKPKIKQQRLVETTYYCMMAGIEQIKPGKTVGDIGYAMESYAKKYGFSTVHDFCGHGIGREFHTQPSILNYGTPKTGIILQPGMFFTVEPMVNIGRKEVKYDKSTGRKGEGEPVYGYINAQGTLASGAPHDGWTIVTADNSLSAQFEHTVAVTETGFEIFTLSPKGYTYPQYI